MKQNLTVKLSILAVIIFFLNVGIGLLYDMLGTQFAEENTNLAGLFVVFMVTIETILFYWGINNFLERSKADEKQQNEIVRSSEEMLNSLMGQLKEFRENSDVEMKTLSEKLSDVQSQKTRFLENVQKKIKSKTEVVDGKLNELGELSDSESFKDKISDCSGSLNSLLRTIDELYLFSTSDNDLAIKPINVDNLIQRITPDLKLHCEKNDIEFSINFVFDRIFEETSDPEASLFISADIEAASKVLTSCILSSSKSLSKTGNINLSIALDKAKLSPDSEETIVCFEISDNGEHFSQEVIKEIEDRTSSDADLDLTEGNDDNLEIIFTANTLKMMDGILFLGKEGSDSWRYRIELPRRPKQKPILDLLIVDDDESVRDALNLTFTVSNTIIEHFQVAEDAAEAREILDKFDFCCCLLDARMPEEDGASLMQFIEQSSPSSKRVMLTGQADKELLQRTVNDGKAHMILYKPWDNEELISILESMIKDSDLFDMKEEKDIKTLWKN